MRTVRSKVLFGQRHGKAGEDYQWGQEQDAGADCDGLFQGGVTGQQGRFQMTTFVPDEGVKQNRPNGIELTIMSRITDR